MKKILILVLVILGISCTSNKEQDVLEHIVKVEAAAKADTTYNTTTIVDDGDYMFVVNEKGKVIKVMESEAPVNHEIGAKVLVILSIITILLMFGLAYGFS